MRSDRRTFHAHLGQLVHRAIESILLEAQGSGRDPLALREATIARVLAEDPFRADRRRGLLLLRSMVTTYLRRYRRAGPWSLIGVERRTLNGGRTDLLFMHLITKGVVADELKTGSATAGYVTAEEASQITAYLRDLREEFGAGLVGVRLVHLGPPSHAQLFTSVLDVPKTRGI